MGKWNKCQAFIGKSILNKPKTGLCWKCTLNTLFQALFLQFVFRNTSIGEGQKFQIRRLSDFLRIEWIQTSADFVCFEAKFPVR